MFLALVVFVAPRCASIGRRGDRTTITASGHAARSEDIARGCDNEFLDSETHALGGVSVAVDHDSKSGLGMGLGMTVGQGTLIASTNHEGSTAPERYMFGSGHGYLSMDTKVFGFDLGASVLVAGTEVIPMPLVTLKFGSMDHLWLELAAGPHDGYFDGEIMGIHIAGRNDDFSLRAGFGGYARALLSRDGEIQLGLDDIGMWPGLRIDGTFTVADGWAISGGFIASETWSGWLGVQVVFGAR